MNHEVLADRLVNYADALAAFSVVNAIGFLVALSETDVRCSLADTRNFVIGGQIASSIIVALAVVLLRRSELKVRASTQLSSDIAGYLRTFFFVRLGIIAASTAFAVTSVMGALSDPSCTPPTS